MLTFYNILIQLTVQPNAVKRISILSSVELQATNEHISQAKCQQVW